MESRPQNKKIQAYYIVKAIAGQAVDINRIFMRDQKSYFTVILDNNNRKPICRLHSGARKMHLGTFDAEKNETRHEIKGVGEIYRFADELRKTLKRYDESEDQQDAHQ